MSPTREVQVPGDKSISHRALLLGAVASGASRVGGLLDSADVRSTASVLRALGVDVSAIAAETTVAGVGLRGLRAPATDLDCGNSGTTTRLIAGMVAGSPISARFVGDASLSRRPMRRIARPLAAMGARIEFENGDGLPFTVTGAPLRGIEWESEVASAQVKTAILLAGLLAGVPVTVREPVRTRDHTERLLAALGVRLASSDGVLCLSPPDAVPAFELRVPGDASSAAFFAALAAAGGGSIALPNVCVDEARIGFLRVLREMGAEVDLSERRVEHGEEVARVSVSAAELRGVSVGEREVPSMVDELPLLACIATRAVGETVVRGAVELRAKESDRIRAVVSNLRALGAHAEEMDDGFRIGGGGAPLRGRVQSHGDHRIAMAFGVLGALPGNDIEVDDRACVAVSYPGFWAELARVTRS